jgi:hypothetical protein
MQKAKPQKQIEKHEKDKQKKGGLAGNTNFYLWFYLPLSKPYTPTSLPDNELPTKAPKECVCVCVCVCVFFLP